MDAADVIAEKFKQLDKIRVDINKPYQEVLQIDSFVTAD
jgi:hypothetical protein